MLQSSLPRRPFLAPSFNYLGYYGDEMHPYGVWHVPAENPPCYSPIVDHHRVLQTWDLARSSTPCPLDLSLKAAAAAAAAGEAAGTAAKEPENARWPAMMLLVGDADATPRAASVHSDSSHEVRDPADRYYEQERKVSGLESPGYQRQLLATPQHQLSGMQHAPMTPPSTPSPPQCPRRKPREEETSPGCRADKQSQRAKKKHARRLKFDEDTSSPVSGTVILGPDEAVVTGDIDPAFNIVEVTEEARAELAKIENRLGPYQCKLCRQLHEDAFQLAQHRCSRIAHVEYRCPECDKRFSCPANLASHRRWHKPRVVSGEASGGAPCAEIPCGRCGAKFTRQAALRKHTASQHPDSQHPDSQDKNVAAAVGAGKTRGGLVHLVPEGPLDAATP